MASYIAVIHKDDDSDYGISFPDFPGCFSAGSTMNEVFVMAAEALAFHIEGLVADGVAIPEPSGLDAVRADPENAGAVIVVVEGPKTKAERFNITARPHEMAKVDGYVRANGLSRSAFMMRAAIEKMEAAGPVCEREKVTA